VNDNGLIRYARSASASLKRKVPSTQQKKKKKKKKQKKQNTSNQ